MKDNRCAEHNIPACVFCEPSELDEQIRAAQEKAWDEGYAAAEADEARLRACPGSSGCDCAVAFSNPYEKTGESK